MAQKLHDTYGFNYAKLKVLLGGWSAWTTAGYPTVTSPTPVGGAAPAAAPPGVAITIVPGGTGGTPIH